MAAWDLHTNPDAVRDRMPHETAFWVRQGETALLDETGREVGRCINGSLARTLADENPRVRYIVGPREIHIRARKVARD